LNLESFGCVDLLQRPTGEWVMLAVGTDGLFSLKAAVGLSTDFTDSTDGPGEEASPCRCFQITLGVKRQLLSTGFQSLESP